MRKKRIEIFRAGRHTAADGRTLQFTAADLDRMVANYDPGVHAAPLVTGHPKHDDPSYGRVQAFVRDGEKLVFDTDAVKDLNPDFAEAVNSGAYDSVSVSLYMPGEASNPKPDGYYVRHVGFLGATPPAIRGLARAEFADGGAGVIEFNEWGDRYVARLLRGVRDWMIGKFGQEEADKALPGWDVNYLQEEAAREETTAAFSEGAEPTTPAVPPTPIEPVAAPTAATPVETSTTAPGAETATGKDDTRETELKKREEELARREAEATKREADQRAQAHKDFCEGLVRQGRPLPAPVESVVNFLRALDGDTVSFGEGDTRSLSVRFREDYLAKLPVSVEFRELAPAGDDEPGDSAEQRVKEIVEYQEQQLKGGVVVTTSEAARATSKSKRSK